ADLDDVARVNDKLLALEKDGVQRTTLRRCYQDPLRQFAAWLSENGRHLDRNPLATWAPLKLKERKASSRRRAFLPDEVARALLASDHLDARYRRKSSQKIVFVSLLVTGARTGALLSREVAHFLQHVPRIDLGADVGKKRRGAAALDATSAA